ncbi:hypothetical protein DIPPA_22674 [Diplonema papillatum]|nr:hypothetical protein DIPPA_22674 [Diplonema papillatum]
MAWRSLCAPRLEVLERLGVERWRGGACMEREWERLGDAGGVGPPSSKGNASAAGLPSTDRTDGRVN